MRSSSFSQARPTNSGSRRHAPAWRALVGLPFAAAACSAAPTETTGVGESRITGNLLTLSSYDGQITNGNGGCLDLPNGDTTNGNLLHIWACNASGWNQTWYVDAKGSIHYAADPTKCVDFPAQHLSGGVPANGTQLQIWDCNGASGADQVWRFSLAGNIEFAADTAKCVELRDGSSANNTPVQVFDCNGTSGQTWQLVQGGGVQGFQLQDGNGACLAAPAAAAGTGLVLEKCNATGTNQTWGMDGRGGLFNYATGLYATFPAQDLTPTTFVPQTPLVMESYSGGQDQAMALSPSSHTLVAGTLACVEARSGRSEDGTIVQGFSCNGTAGQTWFTRPVGLQTRTWTCNSLAEVSGVAVTAPIVLTIDDAGDWTFTGALNSQALISQSYVVGVLVNGNDASGLWGGVEVAGQISSEFANDGSNNKSWSRSGNYRGLATQWSAISAASMTCGLNIGLNPPSGLDALKDIGLVTGVNTLIGLWNAFTSEDGYCVSKCTVNGVSAVCGSCN